MPEIPAISIIVPVYQAEKYLAQCVDSILAQTVTALELVLVNDGSTDASPAICDAYAAKDQRVTVIHKANGGVTSARKVGVRAAAAPFVGFVDADDYIAPTMYEVMLNAAKEHDAQLVECGYRRVENGPEERFASQETRVLTKQEIDTEVLTPLLNVTGEWGCFLVWSCCNKMYNTDLLRKAMLQDDESIAIGEDMLQNVLYLPLCDAAVILAGECNYYYRRSETSVMLAKKVHLGEVAFLQRAAACAPQLGYTGEGMHSKVVQVVLYDLFSIMFYSKMPTGEKIATARLLLPFLANKTYLAQHMASQGLPTKICVSLIKTNVKPLQWLVFKALSLRG